MQTRQQRPGRCTHAPVTDVQTRKEGRESDTNREGDKGGGSGSLASNGSNGFDRFYCFYPSLPLSGLEECV